MGRGMTIPTVKIVYRTNLKMTPGKLASQAVHAALGLGADDSLIRVVVLQASDKKFSKIAKREDCYVVHDAGKTEVLDGTQTCLAFFSA